MKPGLLFILDSLDSDLLSLGLTLTSTLADNTFSRHIIFSYSRLLERLKFHFIARAISTQVVFANHYSRARCDRMSRDTTSKSQFPDYMN